MSVLLVHCPGCDATLEVDGATGAVLSHQTAAVRGRVGSIEEAAAESQRLKRRAEDLFSATVEREKHKSEILEKTFKQALERAQKDPNKPRGIFDDE